MKKLIPISLGLFFASLSVIGAQEQSGGVQPPPKVLVIMREVLKPGKAGSAHQATESNFVQAFKAAQWPTHYLAMDSLSGPSRSLFTVGYDSFAAWEKDNMATQKNATLAAALDAAASKDGELLTSYESSTFVYREDFSLRAPLDIGQMRYMEISRFRVRPGHEKDWEALVKMYVGGYEKAVPKAHWATFEDYYGLNSGGSYLVITPMRSIAEVDQGFPDSKTFAAAMGEEGMKKLGELAAACIESSETNLFMINPKISYVSDQWIKSDPSFWQAK
jgi:hypothetical protein